MGSWPIQTEMRVGRGDFCSASPPPSGSSARSAPRPPAPAGTTASWTRCEQNIHKRLRDFWDAGIRGPDFVWAATGPAMEAYSKHPVVKKANEPGQFMDGRRVPRARPPPGGRFRRRPRADRRRAATRPPPSGLDDVTTYYLLHRHDFGMDDAPVGACILYAISCNLSDNDLGPLGLLVRTGGKAAADEEDEEDEETDGRRGDPAERLGSGSR